MSERAKNLLIKRCSYAKCKNDSRYPQRPGMRGVFFLPFPRATTNLEKRKRWLELCGMTLKWHQINTTLYICSNHFVGKVGPTTTHPDPITVEISSDDDNINLPTNQSYLINLEQVNAKDHSTFGRQVSNAESVLLHTKTGVQAVTTDKPTNIIRLLMTSTLTNYPSGWSCAAFKEAGRLCFNKQLTYTGVPLINIIACINKTFTIHINGTKVDSQAAMFNQLPKTIEQRKDLDEIIAYLDKQRICQGNCEESFKSRMLWAQYFGHFNLRSDAIHSKACSLVLNDSDLVRCKECQYLQATLVQNYERMNKLKHQAQTVLTNF